MCRTVFLRPTELEAHAAQAQTKSLYPPYTPYIPPHAFANLRNPPPPPPLAVEEDKNAFKLPVGLQIVEPSSPIDDVDMELKVDFNSIDVPEEAAQGIEEQNVVQSFGMDSYSSSAFDVAQMSPPAYEANEINFPRDTFATAEFSASPSSFGEVEHDTSLPAQFSELDSTSGESSPISGPALSPNEAVYRDVCDGSAALHEVKPNPDMFTSSEYEKGFCEESAQLICKEDEFSGETRSSSTETVLTGKGKGKKGSAPRVEKWKRRDNEKHLAGERKRRANRMGKLGELKELLPITKSKLSSIKVLITAINHFKTILGKDKKTALAKPAPAKIAIKPKVLDHMTFVQGMRDSQFLSLIEVDTNQVVEHCSPGMKAFMGIDEQMGCGFHLSTILHPIDYAEHFSSVGFTANSSRTLQLRFGCYLHNGHRVFVPSSVTISSDESKCIFVINPLPAVCDPSGPAPFSIHK
mmetsp:Transcript_128014/g.190736  ORF Transcript_128014/g.190736 Transcript_128014/m.190736 type:complete len:466 (-) Transcript_128014:106-1503(-)